MVGGMFNIGEVHRRRLIGLVRRLGGDAVICFCIPAQTEGGGVLYRWRHTLSVTEVEAKQEVGGNFVRKCNVERIKDKRHEVDTPPVDARVSKTQSPQK